jgi:hypothetical protein
MLVDGVAKADGGITALGKTHCVLVEHPGV